MLQNQSKAEIWYLEDKKSCFLIRRKVRKDNGDTDDDVDVWFVEFEETAETFQAGFLLVQFDTDWFIIWQFWESSENVEDEFLVCWENFN